MIVRVSVSKTIQEKQYEPLTISVTCEKDFPKSKYTKELKDLHESVQSEVRHQFRLWGVKLKK